MDNSRKDITFDETKPTMIGHLMIRDPETGEVIIDRRDRVVKNNMTGSANADRNE